MVARTHNSSGRCKLSEKIITDATACRVETPDSTVRLFSIFKSNAK